jgi:hypothetical protein
LKASVTAANYRNYAICRSERFNRLQPAQEMAGAVASVKAAWLLGVKRTLNYFSALISYTGRL